MTDESKNIINFAARTTKYAKSTPVSKRFFHLGDIYHLTNNIFN